MRKKTGLITGSTSALGLALIPEIVDQYDFIFAHYRTPSSKLVELSQQYPQIKPIQADLCHPSDVSALIASIQTQAEHLDHIIHMASPGIMYQKFTDLPLKTFEENMQVQVYSLIQILQAFLPSMAKKRAGKVIIALSSVTLNSPPGAMSAYVTAKYALLGLFKTLVKEYASKKIQLNAISPDMIDTSFISQIPEAAVAMTIAQHPLRRLATTQDILPMLKLLLSEELNYLNGVNIPLTGGSAY